MAIKRKLWQIHAWLGLYVGTLILVMSLTGSVIVFREELDEFLNPALYKVGVAGADKISLDELAGNVVSAHPGYSLQHMRFHGRDEIFEIRLKGGKNAGGDLDIFVDPSTGNMNGERSPESGFVYWLTKLHTNLLSGKPGRYIVGFLGVALLAMLITGLIIYFNFMKRQKFAKIRRGQGKRKLYADWHKLIGISSIPFNLLWSVTGMSMAFLPVILESTVGKPQETFAKPGPLTTSIPVTPFTYDHIFATVSSRYPEADIRFIREATKENPFIELRLDFGKPLISAGAARVLIDKKKQEVVSLFDPRSAAFGTRLFYSQQPLHFGTYAGNWSRIIHSVFGLSSGLLFVSGFIVWRNRRKRVRA